MKEYLPLLIGLVVGCVAFVLLWRKGYFLRVSGYVQETKEELRKCTWPDKDELVSSTSVVMVAIALLGAFTVAIDSILTAVVRLVFSI